MLTKREHTEIFLTLVFAWLVYAVCQGELIVPALAFLCVLPSYIKQMSGRPTRRSSIHMSWRSLISISIVVSGTWRNLFPSPDNAVSFIPILVPALQTASIFVAILAWFRFDYKWRTYYLRFLPWLTVALSINVPFTVITQFVFWFYCYMSVGIMIGHLYFPVSPDTAEAFKRSKYKSPFLYAYPVFLAVIAVAIFFVIVQSIHLGDDIFMHLIQNYVGRRHFSLFDSTLNLSGSGNSRNDVRPILEIDRTGGRSHYLVAQIFKDYQNGVWTAVEDLPTDPVSREFLPSRDTFELVMFEYLADIIPVPRGVAAMHSKGTAYVQDANGVVYNVDKKIPKAELQLGEVSPGAKVGGADRHDYTAVSDFLRKHLKIRNDYLIGRENDPLRIARKMEHFFRTQFEYNLYVDFVADDKGLIYMLDYRRPAYCSYFASAMTLMLRERGIPARLVAGFLATEKSAFSDDKYIVRGRDAHAWVEALIPVRSGGAGPDKGTALYDWVRFDPTPPDSRLSAIDRYSKINKIADWIWCSQKRLKAAILDIETRTLVALLFAIVIMVALEEIFKKFLGRLFKRHKGDEVWTETRLSRKQNPYVWEYKRLEHFLKTKFHVERKDSETDTELLTRLRGLPEVPGNVVLKIEAFFIKYHMARFGFKKDVDLTLLLEDILQGRK